MISVEDIKKTINQLHIKLADVVSHAEEDIVHVNPEQNAWSVAQILSHVAEFEDFFSKDLLQLKQSPEVSFGRTMEHPDRLKAVDLIGSETVQELLERVEKGRTTVISMLDTLTSNDLQIVGHNPKFGDKTILWIIEHFLTEHLEKHIGQIERTYLACRTV